MLPGFPLVSAHPPTARSPTNPFFDKEVSSPETKGRRDDVNDDDASGDLQRRINQRSKQIIFGKVTQEYFNLAQGHSVGELPRTPRTDLQDTKRQFDARSKAWRRALHSWGPPNIKQNWISPALQYAFDNLKDKYPEVKTPRDLIEGDTQAPPHETLQFINIFFSSFFLDRCLIRIPQKTAAEGNLFWETAAD